MFVTGLLYSRESLEVEHVRVLTDGSFAAVDQYIGRHPRAFYHECRVSIRRDGRTHKFSVFYTRTSHSEINHHIQRSVRMRWAGDALVLAVDNTRGKYASITDVSLARYALRKCASLDRGTSCSNIHDRSLQHIPATGRHPTVIP